MKALVYRKAHPIEQFAMELVELPDPAIRDTDLLVSVRAIGINPGEAMFRGSRSAENGGQVLLGWEFSGVVEKIGKAAKGFKVGDRVFGTGDLLRDGCWAEKLAIDSRIVGRLPGSISFAEAASLPIGSLTAWQALFRDEDQLPNSIKRVLVVGGAGAVGSMAIQLLEARAHVFVIATASREESKQWCKGLGADLVLDHSGDIRAQLSEAKLDSVDLVFVTRGLEQHLGWIPSVLRPYGHLATSDMGGPLDLSGLFMKSISLHPEMVFGKIMNNYDASSQSKALETVASLILEKRIKPIATTQLDGLSASTMKVAHELIESGKTIGKIVIRY